jgi:hypothetical protein
MVSIGVPAIKKNKIGTTSNNRSIKAFNPGK